ncbi:solute carrier family 35 member F6-like [Anneissia japonica]|uniref:solute carrier family 35 member F6-like n=1 Tax=Anneissia japonica TaxID=1529436 RepID=UPI00142581FD|nr:solute carrier family 35 member F6-like [Anneissia japonica]XP_033127914.1 solute carrier family 35 member F6-like [Anneissia japonica]XP_033127915.1 solute carrier family 35 member F6-like [Anneissia japonica]
MALTAKQMLLALGMLVTGSINTLSKKAQNDCNVVGRNGTDVHEFDHPWFQTVLMFIGESTCLVALLISRHYERKQFRQSFSIQNNDDETQIKQLNQPRVFQFIFIIPTLCDLFGTTLAGIGLLYVTASVWQMLRGSIIVFAGILSRLFLKRKLKCYHWSGIVLTMFGLLLVGLSSVLQDEEAGYSSKTVLGIVLILGSQFISATQMIIEELFLKTKGYPPLQVVGMEGSFGVLIMSFIVLPILYYIPDHSAPTGRYEDSIDALYQIKNSTKLLIFSLLYLCSIAFYNFFGLSVTKSLTAVHRTLIDACRTILVWFVDLIIYYAFDKGFGEEFDVTYGILQIDGFMFLMIGTAMYNGLMPVDFIPCCRDDSQPNFTSSVNDEDNVDDSSNDKASLLKNTEPDT